MDTLFPVESVSPPGFSYIPAFISGDEETTLLAGISHLPLAPMQFRGYEAKRKTVSFGYDWNFESRTLSRGKPIPAAFDFIIEKVARHIGIDPHGFAELLVTEYPVGSVINWHRDAPPFGIIAGLSLASDCHFRFRPHEKALQSRRSILTIPVHRRSLYIIRGEARSNWEHSTAPVDQVRYSLTLRTLK